MKQSKVPDSPKMLGQDMTKKQPEKLSTRYALNDLCPYMVDCLERHASVLILENVLLRDYTSIQIAAQIGQCLVASSNGFAVDDPLYGGLAGAWLFAARPTAGFQNAGSEARRGYGSFRTSRW